MPELPELEALARSLRTRLPGAEIESVAVYSPSVMKTFDPPLEWLEGDRMESVVRRGKWLLLGTTAGRALGIHLMTGGRLRQTEAGAKPTRADALSLRLAHGFDLRVSEIGTKKQSGVYLVKGSGQELVSALGPEPLTPELTIERLAAALAGPAHQVKAALTDQRRLAGLGNAWSDEVLHAARLSPLMLTTRLTPENIGALHTALRECLLVGIAHASEDNYLEKLKPDRRTYLRIHNRKGQPCFVCQTPLAAIHFVERATTYCPTCQSEGRVYADRRLSRLLK